MGQDVETLQVPRPKNSKCSRTSGPLFLKFVSFRICRQKFTIDMEGTIKSDLKHLESLSKTPVGDKLSYFKLIHYLFRSGAKACP